MCKSLKGGVTEDYAPARISPETYLLMYEVALSAAKAGTRLIELGALQKEKLEKNNRYAEIYKAKFGLLNKNLEKGIHDISNKLKEIVKIKSAEKEKSGQKEKELEKILYGLLNNLESASREK